MRLARLLRALAASMPLLISPLAASAQSLDMTTWQLEEPGVGDWWKEVIAAYAKANPGKSVNVQQIQYKDYVNQLTVRFASNRPPHIITMPTDGFGVFADQGWLAPLDDRAKATPIATNWSSLQSDLVWDGKTQGVLLMGYGFMLFYNEQLLNEAGVKPPASFEEFRQAVAKITNRDKGIFGLAAVTTEHPTVTLDFVRFIEWQGADLVKDGKYNLADPAVVKAIENYRETVGGHAPLGNNSTIARQLFVDGKAAFLIDGPWMYARIEQAKPEMRAVLKMVKAPFTPTLGGASNSIHIPAALDAKAKDEAWSFIRFITQPEWQLRYTQLTAAPPGLKGAVTPEVAAEKPHLKLINEAVIGAEPIIPNIKSIRANSNEFFAITQRAALRVLSTKEPVAAILKDAQAELDRAIPLN